jgi:CdiI immunity protein
MKDNTYEQLQQLVNAYFHQDWPDDHGDEEAVLTDFVHTNWSDDVQQTIAQIDRYLAEHPTGVLESFVSDFNPMITIGADDAEARAWLERARAHLSQHISLSPVRDDGGRPLDP